MLVAIGALGALFVVFQGGAPWTLLALPAAIFISIRPVSWGPERNEALRAIFAATHKHAQSKKRVLVQWGDAMTSTAQMSDIKAFVAGHITYREILNRLEWSGTPDILPDGDSLDDSAKNQALWPVPMIGYDCFTIMMTPAAIRALMISPGTNGSEPDKAVDTGIPATCALHGTPMA